jgi:uncharacterized protein YbbK (DUF523 family)
MSLARALKHASLEMEVQERIVEVKLPSCGARQVGLVREQIEAQAERTHTKDWMVV